MSNSDAERGMWCDVCGFTKNSTERHQMWHALIQKAKIFGRYFDYREG